MLCAVAHRTQLHLCTSRRHTDDHPERLRQEMMMHIDHLNESSHHLLACVEVGDDPVLERSARDDVLVCFLMHHLGLAAHCDHPLGVAVHSHHRRFIDHDLPVHDDDGVGRSEVHCNILC